MRSLSLFQDKEKAADESYNVFYKELNRLAELCDFKNKDEFLKYKLFLAARKEPYFTAKFADLGYKKCTVKSLLTQLTNLEY